MMAALVSIASVTILEGNTGTQNAAVTVIVSEPHSNAVSVDYSTAAGTAMSGSDYEAVAGTLTFAKNELSKTILIPVIGDRAAEFSETLFVNLKNAKGGAKIANSQAAVTILDNEPRISINDLSQVEGQSGTSAFNFTVSLSAAYDQPVTINYSTADGSAKAGTDFTAVSGSVVFAAGETSKTIPVLVNGNRLPESDRTFFVNVNTPNSYAEITKAVGVGAIADNEPRISINDVSVLKGNTGVAPLTFTVNLSATYDQAVSVNYTTTDGSATAGNDYAAAAGTVTFQPGQTTQQVIVQVNGDRLPEPNKSFLVSLSSASSNAYISKSTGIGTIIDDEPRISIANSWNYGEATFTFTVSLQTAYDETVTVNFATADGPRSLAWTTSPPQERSGLIPARRPKRSLSRCSIPLPRGQIFRHSPRRRLCQGNSVERLGVRLLVLRLRLLRPRILRLVGLRGMKQTAGEAYRQASSSPARHLSRRSVCASRAMTF